MGTAYEMYLKLDKLFKEHPESKNLDILHSGGDASRLNIFRQSPDGPVAALTVEEDSYMTHHISFVEGLLKNMSIGPLSENIMDYLIQMSMEDRSVAEMQQLIEEYVFTSDTLNEIKSDITKPETEHLNHHINKPASETLLEDLDLSVYTFRQLSKAGIKTADELVNKTLTDMFKIKNIGINQVDEIVEKMQAKGFDLPYITVKTFETAHDKQNFEKSVKITSNPDKKSHKKTEQSIKSHRLQLQNDLTEKDSIIKAVNIKWDVDYEEDLKDLPTEIEIPNGINDDEISDYLSDVTGFCHKGYELLEQEQIFNRDNYKGYQIQTCYDSGIIRQNDKGENEICEGYYCTLHPIGSPDIQIDDFCLAAGYEITDISDEALDAGIKEHIDSMGKYNIFKDYTQSEIENIIRDYIQEAINLADVGDEITIKGIKLYGSRTRDDFVAGSDLDVLVEYEGDYKEYMLFNLLHDKEDPAIINGILIDINPIRAEESGTIEEYYTRVCDFRKENRETKTKISLDTKINDASLRTSTNTIAYTNHEKEREV